jgi:hypothetical protein
VDMDVHHGLARVSTHVDAHVVSGGVKSLVDPLPEIVPIVVEK